MHAHITPHTTPHSPRHCLVTALSDIYMSQDASSLKQAFDALCPNTLVSEETLEADFNRFFIGPFTPVADLFASVYLDDPELVMSKSTLQVRSL